VADRRRLDAAVVERGLAESRARAQALILGGGVTVDGTVVTKPANPVTDEAQIALVREPMPYVSRGGLKLRHALDAFAVRIEDAIVLDVGASTGGFTDVVLQAGARRVYAIDVGYGQLAWTLRNDNRVVVMERTNIRHLTTLPEQADLAVIDTSFISLTLVLPPVAALLKEDGEVVALIKPQFEAGKGRVGRGGVVRDPAIWREVLIAVLTFAHETRWEVVGLTRSPIRGPAGNVEFLVHLSRGDRSHEIDVGSAIEAVLVPESDGEPQPSSTR
jgi:23S rRNA (cytidine1920-2'-O)/16S rRNA (cytidine1409-2'-O)-methyltransferase